ncbi:alpha/beta hydrolase [Acidothermaceae bacterium B102]|nr:alpha/beta hydrolase [Acidothermaceae bacterium B102]
MSQPVVMSRLIGRKLWLIALALVLAVSVGLMPSASRAASSTAAPKPTIVLVHGAFADASGWNAVAAGLQKRGYTVYAPANPLRGLTSDAAYVRSFIATIKGPIIMVGHSYGGAVITNAATGNKHVKALVYIAAYALAKGEAVGQANALGGAAPSLLLSHIVVRPFAGAAKGDADAYIDPAFFRQVFAADLPAKQAALMAAEQRPGSLSSLAQPSGTPAWATIPSWYLVAHDDNAIPPAAERAMAARAHAHTVEIDSSHVAMISHPSVVTKLILNAARS